MKSIEYRQERAKLVAEARRLVDAADSEQREMTAEETEGWDKYNQDIDKLGRLADQEERREHVSKLEDELRSVTKRAVTSPIGTQRQVTPKERRLAFLGWLKGGTDRPVSTEERQAGELLGLSPYNGSLTMRAEQRTDMLVGSAGAGLELATFYPGIAQYIDVALKAYGNVWQTSTVIPTFNGIQFKLPVVDPTGNLAVIVGESSGTTAVVPTTAAVTFNCFTYRAQYKASLELLQDSLLDLETFIAQHLAEQFYRGTNAHFMTGNGSTQPQGMASAATDSGVTLSGGSSAACTVKADDLIDLEHSVDPLYRRSAKAGFVMHDATLAVVRKLKDSNGQYLWTTAGGFSNAVAQAQPDRILGYPVHINQDCPKLGTAAHQVVLFGDLSKYYVRRVMEYTFLRQNELYSANGEFGFLGFMRLDAKLVDAGTHPIKCLTNI